MIRFLKYSPLLVVLGCTTAKPDVISSINYLQEPIEAQCAYEAVRDADGFAVADRIQHRGTAQHISAQFNETTPVQILVRDLSDGTAEVSAFVRLAKKTSPLDRRAAAFAVRAADEAIYRSCTTDGQTYGDNADIILETQDQK